jgi:Calcineurin-like phosphoesterase
MCGGTPAGDNWDAWNADFFSPAAKLLAAAPWAFSRGNHEDCERSWRGWFYYLDPRPWNGSCERFSSPYLVTLGTFELVMLDSASVSANTLNKEQAALYATQLASLHPAHAWLADHHPFWGMRTDSAEGKPAPVSPTLAEAWERAAPTGIDLILSGHVHLFELFSFDHGRPTQLVAGDGGTNLAMALQGPMRGLVVDGASVLASENQRQFGYSLLTRHGKTWDLMLKNRVRNVLVDCTIPIGRASCQTPAAE